MYDIKILNVHRALAVVTLLSAFGGAGAQGTAALVTTATLSKSGDGSYQAVVSLSNTGTGIAQNVVVSTASLGSAAGTPLPKAVGNIAAGGVVSTAFAFPGSAGASGTAVVERFAGSYTGGTFGGSLRVVLPATADVIAQLNSLIAQAQALETGNREFPLQISNSGTGSEVNKAFPWVTAAEFKGLDDALKSARNALIQWNAQAIPGLQSAIATFKGQIKADGSDPYFRLDPGPGRLPVTITAATNAWTARTPLDNRVPADFDGSSFGMIPYPFADSQGQAPVLLINYLYKGTATFGGVSMQSPLTPAAVNVPTGATIEFDVYYPKAGQGKLMRWRMTNRSTTVDSYLRAYDYTSLNPTWIGSYNGDTWFKTHVSVNVPQTGSSSTFVLELHGETGRPAENTKVMVQNLKITQPDPNTPALPNVVNTQNQSVVAPLKGLYSRDNGLFMVGALGTGAVTGTRARHYEIFVDGNNLKADATQPRGPNWLTSTTGAALSGATTTPGLGEYSFPDSSYTAIRDSGTPGQYKIHGHVMAWYNQAPSWMAQIIPPSLSSGYAGTPYFYGLGNGVPATVVPVSKDMARRVQFNHITYLMRHFLTTSTKYGSSAARGVVPFNSWDILNEEVHESRHSVNIPLDPNSWRLSLKHTNWLVAMSDDLIGGDLKDHYVYLLFKFAHIAAPNARMAAAFKANYASLPDYMKLDGHDDSGSIDAYIMSNPTKLTYNDYGFTHTKARTVYNMVRALNTAWLSDPLYDGRPLIEIVGNQAHDGVSPTQASDTQYSTALFAKLVDDRLLSGISYSEFDLLIPTSAPGGGATAPAALNIRQSDALGYQYALMYKLFTKFAPYIDHALSWGVAGAGWQGSYLLFDSSSNAMGGYYGAMNPNRYILGHSYLDDYFAGENDKLQNGYPIDLGDLGIYVR